MRAREASDPARALQIETPNPAERPIAPWVHSKMIPLNRIDSAVFPSHGETLAGAFPPPNHPAPPPRPRRKEPEDFSQFASEIRNPRPNEALSAINNGPHRQADVCCKVKN